MPALEIFAEGALRPNRLPYPKPLEDYLYLDNANQIYLILDGVSRDRQAGVYPHPSPAAAVSRLFAEAAAQTLCAARQTHPPSVALRQAALAGNRRVKAYNDPQTWDFLPGTVGIVAFVMEDTFHYCYVGDCSGRLVASGQVRVFTRSQTQLVRAHHREFSADEIRHCICNHSAHPYGYGVFTGEDEAMDFLEFGQEPLQAGDVILLATDGLDEFLNSEDLATASLSAQALVNRAVAHERANDLKSDDKAMIVITGRAPREGRP